MFSALSENNQPASQWIAFAKDSVTNSSQFELESALAALAGPVLFDRVTVVRP